MSAAPRLLGLATAVPEHELTQDAARALAARLLAARRPGLARLLGVFARAGVARRQLARPPSWYARPRTLSEKNAAHVEAALELGARAARGALARACVAAADVGAVVYVTSTGLATPGVEATLAQILGLPARVQRVPLWGLGCAGGVAGLARADLLARVLGGPVLLIAVETCSLTFLHADASRSNLVAMALFGDGAAAAVIGPGARGPALVARHAHLVPDSQAVMGWDVVDDGLKVRFAPTIPGVVRRHAGAVARAARAAAGLAPDAALGHVLHPGGPKVLAAYREALGADAQDVARAAAVLRDHGNMSSPTALFVLARQLADGAPAPGHHSLCVALGPGFAAETVILAW